MDFVTVSTGLILPYWMGLPIRYIQRRKEEDQMISKYNKMTDHLNTFIEN